MKQDIGFIQHNSRFIHFNTKTALDPHGSKLFDFSCIFNNLSLQ